MGSGKDQHIPGVKSHYRLLSTKVWKQPPAREVLKLLITGSWDWSMSGEGSPSWCQCCSKHLLLADVGNGILDQTDFSDLTEVGSSYMECKKFGNLDVAVK